MSEKISINSKKTDAQRRDERLKAALKANMSRRKAQAKARAQNTDAQERAAKDE